MAPENRKDTYMSMKDIYLAEFNSKPFKTSGCIRSVVWGTEPGPWERTARKGGTTGNPGRHKPVLLWGMGERTLNWAGKAPRFLGRRKSWKRTKPIPGYRYAESCHAAMPRWLRSQKRSWTSSCWRTSWFRKAIMLRLHHS